MSVFTIGADPELFLFQGERPVSCHGLIPGDKQNPHPVKQGAVQVDGLAAEFNIDPAHTREEWLHNISTVMGELQSMLPAYQLKAIPVAVFGKEYIASQPEEAKELGCDPDFNAWTYGDRNPKPDGDRDFRTGAGHVHVGCSFKGMKLFEFVYQMDFYLGLASLFWDDDTKRREMYGRAGCYRKKPYGVEYRTLSNAWLSNEKLINLVFTLTKKAYDDFLEGVRPFEFYGDEVEHVINSSNKGRAEEMLKERGLYHLLGGIVA